MAPGTAFGSRKFKRCRKKSSSLVGKKSFLDASETQIQDAELAVVMCLGGGQG